ncbi:MAG TPA: glycine oxidase ThiO [Pirellulaceae bacterium]|jgi:glycine oxidase|nr:glycine oxidase ThiO [Pirellulaceae bacterium]
MTTAVGHSGNADVAIVGAGAIGLSLAWELARRGKSVTLLDAGEPGHESSWAGAGILPPCLAPESRDPLTALHRLSMELHPVWAERLQEATGVDVGFRSCGGVYLAYDRGEAAALAGMAFEAEASGVPVETWSPEEIVRREPALGQLLSREKPLTAKFFPGECQIRNPRFVRALRLACEQAGVAVRPHVRVRRWKTEGRRLVAVRSDGVETIAADAFVAAAGAWTQELLGSIGVAPEIFPIRGQMLLYESPEPRLRSVLNVGPRYFVPRDDGLLLVGATEEEVGFGKANTAEGVAELRRFAERTLPALADREPLKTWAGLRPATFDGLPYLGRVPGLENLYVAAGHFRAGLTLSPGTAVVVADELCGQTPAVDLQPFRVGR